MSRIVGEFDEDEHAPLLPSPSPDSSPPTSTPESTPVQGDPDLALLTFEPVIEPELPDSFRLTEQAAAGDNQIELHYMADDGLHLTLVESPPGAFEIAVPLEHYQVYIVNGVEVLMLQETNFDSVEHLVWEHGGIVFDLLVVETTATRNLGFVQAEAVVMALIAAGDS